MAETNPTNTPELIERVAKAICWEGNGKAHDCNTACMASNECQGPVAECFKRDARAAIEAMPEISTLREALEDARQRWQQLCDDEKLDPGIRNYAQGSIARIDRGGK